MFNRIARFALCLALLSLSACAGAARQTHGAARGTAQAQQPLLAELLLIGILADAGREDGDSRGRRDSSGGGSAGQTEAVLLGVGAIGAVVGIAYLVFSDAGDVGNVGAPRPSAPYEYKNNVSAAPGFITAAQRGAL